MSMSTNIYGMRQPDEEWKKKVTAWKACQDAGVEPPRDLEDYFDKFNSLPPDATKGPRVDLEGTPCCKEYEADREVGFEIEISKIPPGLSHIRFVNSY